MPQWTRAGIKSMLGVLAEVGLLSDEDLNNSRKHTQQLKHGKPTASYRSYMVWSVWRISIT